MNPNTPGATVRNGGALVFTVGAGNRDRIRESLLTPLMTSILDGEWARLIAVPSQETKQRVGELQDLLPEHRIETWALPQPGMEDDVDRVFVHMDYVFGRLRHEGFRPDQIVADYTRGTKAMSAATVLAATGHGIQVLRYITGPRDERGAVLPGQERLSEVRPELTLTRRKLELGAEFIRSGQFRAAEQLFPPGGAEPSGSSLKSSIADLRWQASFWGCWDVFDYEGAARLLDSPPPGLSGPLAPAPENRQLVKRLAETRERTPNEAAEQARDRCADMLASARRRIRFGETEDALIRCYRAAEMLGQIRLFAHGLDSEDLNPRHPAVERALRERRLHEGPGDLICAARIAVIGLLKDLRDPLARQLSSLDDNQSVDVRARNQSILIHGRRRQAGDEQELRRYADKVAAIFRDEHPANAARIEAATFPWMRARR